MLDEKDFPQTFEEAESMLVKNLLRAKSHSEEFNEDESNAAVMFIVVAEFIAQGVDPETACNLYDSACDHGDIKVSLTNDELRIKIGEDE